MNFGQIQFFCFQHGWDGYEVTANYLGGSCYKICKQLHNPLAHKRTPELICQLN